MVTTREDEDTIFFGLQLLKTILPDDAFHGNGPVKGPTLAATDDSEVIRNALRRAWPDIILLLCQFHVLQAHWNWLWTSKNSINHEDKSCLLLLFRRILYAETDDQFNTFQEKMFSDPVCQKYEKYQKYVSNLLARKDEWSTLFRIKEHLPTSGQNTTNLCESSFRREKEDIFNRHRAHNLPDMIRLVIESSEGYSMRCVDAANGALSQRLKNQKSRYLVKKTQIYPSEVKQVGKDTFEVPSETKNDVKYNVNLRLRLCSCHKGQQRGPCKHKSLVSSKFNLPNYDEIPTTPEMKSLFMYLGTGRRVEPSWFYSLHKTGTETGEGRGQVLAEGNRQEMLQLVETGSNTPEEYEGEVEEGWKAGGGEGGEQRVELVKRKTVIDKNALKEKLRKSIESFTQNIESRIDNNPEGYEASVEIFVKQLTKLEKVKQDSVLQKTLCSFGKSVTAPLSLGKK